MLLTKKYRISVLFIVFFGLILSCNDSEKKTTHAVLRGEIVNPQSNYLILEKDSTPLDTIFFDEKNQFFYQIEAVEPGLYSLKHATEDKFLHIAPGDSILIRTNTMGFDESFHFSGPNAQKNNFLSDIFLWNKKNKGLFIHYYKMEPRVFSRLADSIKNAQLHKLGELNKKHQFSDNFTEIVKKSLQYQSFNFKEQYTFLLNKYYPELSKNINPEFHKYRDSINFNDTIVHSSPIYTRLIKHALINRAMTNCLEKTDDDKKRGCFDYYSTENIIRRINLIDSLSDLPILKENLYFKFGTLGMTMGKSKEDLISVLRLLEEKGIDKKKLFELQQLGSIQLAFMPGIQIKDISLIKPSGKEILSQESINKPTILHIWSVDNPDKQEQEHKKIQEYREKYPEINFIAINVDIGRFEEWVNTIKKYGYAPSNEFQLGEIELIENRSMKKELFKHYLDKMLFMNKSGEVIYGDANLYSPDFEARILEFLNQ